MLEMIYFYLPALESVRDFFELGGEVLILIALVTFFMWAMICERLLYLFGPHGRAVQRTVAAWEKRSDRSSWYAKQIRTQMISVVGQALE
ncbi:MAG: MotA/TolQ/ExbB proton channel family protein, partial [Pseudomonadota bacterium]